MSEEDDGRDDVDCVPLGRPNAAGYVFGRGGGTARKLERASGCRVDVMGEMACLRGGESARVRARAYLALLLDLLGGVVCVDRPSLLPDCTVLHVPSCCIGYLTGFKGSTLCTIEEQTGTLCVINEGRRCARTSSATEVELLVLGHSARARATARASLVTVVRNKLGDGVEVPHEDYPLEKQQHLRRTRTLR
eukprot:TRINITY_DN4843_c0_g1_i1.p2 TRINITY_DN4843_c0_g1~~TRINITY_DN4843_c0_g1_i1.p2  ORF type:complete len:204 (-),score=68.21 TRINITY_DN4843_c0_g1_i1:12-587(-)